MDLSLNFATNDVPKGRKSKSGKAGSAAGSWKLAAHHRQAATPKQQQHTQSTVSNQGQNSSIAPTSSSFSSTAANGRASTSKSALLPAKTSTVGSKRVHHGHGKAAAGAAQTTTTTNNLASDADGEQKRPFISSLFPRLPLQRFSQPGNNDSEDVNGDATASDEPALLDPSNAPSMADSFDGMPLSPNMISHLKGKMGLSNPTLIQKLAIPFLADEKARHRDAILQAQTGSGKTLSYLLPIVSDLLRVSEEYSKTGKQLERSVGTLAIVLVPTRELAVQIFEVATRLLSFPAESAAASHRWITPGLLTGGAHRQHEKARLRKGVPLLIATPGRLLDHLETTKAFRLAGEALRKPKDASNRSGNTNTAGDSDDEFDIEDNIPGPISESALDNDDVSSDEDFESRAVSRSYRGNMPIQPEEELALNPHILLRWLILDEADRLMDMGFEPQIKSIVEILASRLDKRKAVLGRTLKHTRVRDRLNKQKLRHVELDQRRTLLCSATIEDSVERLAGVALKEPLIIKGDSATSEHTAKAKSGSTGAPAQYTPPSQLSQYYTVAEPKLRFVTLIAVLRQILLSPLLPSKTPQKILVFLSCTDSVDLHWQALSSLQMGASRTGEQPQKPQLKSPAQGEPNVRSEASLLPGTSVYRLHGSLDLRTRLASLKGYSDASQRRAVMFCTSVAARGLDVQDVTAVVQYDLPTEGGVTEYVHRVGRTARAGARGQSWTLLLPSEVPWVRWAETEMHGGSTPGTGAGHLQERQVNTILKAGYGGRDRREVETRATDVQMAYERWVSDDPTNSILARKAFSSHVRAYATHPSNEKEIFHVKKLHLGHLAKAFGLREAPAGIVSMHKPKKAQNGGETQSEKRKRSQASDGAAESSDEEENDGRPKGKKIPRSGRALDGKGLHGPKASTRGDFNIASNEILGKAARKKF